MGSFVELIRNISRRETDRIDTGFVAEIVSFDKSTMRAVIKPRLKIINRDKTEKLFPNINDVPVQCFYCNNIFIRPDYASGDIVNVQSHAASIRIPLDSGVNADKLNDRFNANNCLVTGSILPSNFNFPTEFAQYSGLVMGGAGVFMQFDGQDIFMKNGATTATLKSDKLDVVGDIHATGTITGDTDVIAGTKSGKTHTHTQTANPVQVVPVTGTGATIAPFVPTGTPN